MSETAKQGDIVVLKSQPSIPMTVNDLKGDVATCVWLNKSGKREQGVFHISTLVVIPPEALNQPDQISVAN